MPHILCKLNYLQTSHVNFLECNSLILKKAKTPNKEPLVIIKISLFKLQIHIKPHTTLFPNPPLHPSPTLLPLPKLTHQLLHPCPKYSHPLSKTALKIT